MTGDMGGRMPVVFPVLVYFDRDERAWVGISMLTCTTAVEETATEAARVVADLLKVEVDAALEHNDGNPDLAFDSMFCIASPQLWPQFWHANATPLTPGEHDGDVMGTQVRIYKDATRPEPSHPLSPKHLPEQDLRP